MRRIVGVAGAVAMAALLSAHVGSPNVFFSGSAGPYAVRVVVRPPEVVPGIARVTVHAPADVQRISIRPVYWRAGSQGAPSADEMRRVQGEAGTFEGSLWLMARGAYSVDVIVDGARGQANVLVPVASVATGRLELGTGLGALLIALGALLCAGLVTIVYKGAGESLVNVGGELDAQRRARARRIAAMALPLVGLALLGGANWWRDVDGDYQRTIYRPSPLRVNVRDGVIHVAATDTVFRPPRRAAALVPDHGKLMHLFLIRSGDAGAIAHLHPVPQDSSTIPEMAGRLPPLPAGEYHVYGDVVHETGFERTLVATVRLDSMASARWTPTDADDAWWTGIASVGDSARLSDGSVMRIAMEPAGALVAGTERTIHVSVTNARGDRVALEPYMGMSAHAVIMRLDGSTYVHLHTSGTVTMAAREAFLARDRGDTTRWGDLLADAHTQHASAVTSQEPDTLDVQFPYEFPRSGDYRLFVQVKHSGSILTGAFALPVADSAVAPRP